MRPYDQMPADGAVRGSPAACRRAAEAAAATIVAGGGFCSWLGAGGALASGRAGSGRLRPGGRRPFGTDGALRPATVSAASTARAAGQRGAVRLGRCPTGRGLSVIRRFGRSLGMRRGSFVVAEQPVRASRIRGTSGCSGAGCSSRNGATKSSSRSSSTSKWNGSTPGSGSAALSAPASGSACRRRMTDCVEPLFNHLAGAGFRPRSRGARSLRDWPARRGRL